MADTLDSKRISKEFLLDPEYIPQKPKSRNSKFYFCILLSLFLSTTVILAVNIILQNYKSPGCPIGYTYFEKTGQCYKAASFPVTFERARELCDSEDSKLPSIYSIGEDEFLETLYGSVTEERPVSFWKNYKLEEEKDIKKGFICMKSLRSSKSRRSLSDVSETKSTEGQDIATGIERAMKIVEGFFKGIASLQKPPRSPGNTTEGVTTTTEKANSTLWVPTTRCHSGYSYFEGTGFCYRAYPEFSTFEEAKEICATGDAVLTSIHSEMENNFVIKLARESFGKSENTYAYRHRVWIGLVYSNETEDWSWEDGSKVDYTKWIAGEPNRLDEEHWTTIVIEIYKDSNQLGDKWNNQKDNDKEAFVCKQKQI